MTVAVETEEEWLWVEEEASCVKYCEVIEDACKGPVGSTQQEFVGEQERASRVVSYHPLLGPRIYQQGKS